MTRKSLILLIAVVFVSCNPKKNDVECTGYEGSPLWEQYFPYKAGDVLTFVDNRGYSYTLRIGDIYETEHKIIPHDKFLSDEDQQINCDIPSRRITSENYYSQSKQEFKIEHIIQTLYGSYTKVFIGITKVMPIIQFVNTQLILVLKQQSP